MSLLRHTSDTLTWERKIGGNFYIIVCLSQYVQLTGAFHSIDIIFSASIYCAMQHFPTQYSLLDVLPEMSNLKVPTELRELPDDITLAQTVALWKYIVYYQSHQRQDY